MTTEQPTRPARPPRPGPAFRRAALGLPPVADTDRAPRSPGVEPGAVARSRPSQGRSAGSVPGRSGEAAGPVSGQTARPPAPPAAPATPQRESLREALARIPDLERDDIAAPAPLIGGAAAGGAVAASAAGGAAARATPDVTVPGRRRSGAGAGEAVEDRSEGGATAGPTGGEGGPEADDAAPVPDLGARADDAEQVAASPISTDGRGIRAIASRLLNGQVPADAELADVSEIDGLAGASTGVDPAVADDVPLFVAKSSDVEPADAQSATRAPAVAAAGTAIASELPPDAPEWLVEAAEVEREAAARTAARLSPKPPLWRRIGFASLVILLLASIPVLGRIGYELVTESTDGRFTSNVKSPTDPGFETEVVSTPTQILMQNDETGRPVAATVLSLSGAEGGGAVIFVPLATEVRTPAFGVDRISRAYDVLADRPPDGRKQVAVQVASVLNVGIDGVVEVDDRGWAQLVAPVAPLSITNPDPILVDGVEIPSGPIELSAEQVGPYLAATRDGESAFNALVRHELVWDAWLTAISESDRDDVVPGESESGIGLFARSLADGPVTYSIVPTDPDDDDPTLLRFNDAAIGAIVLAAVPSPDPALPGSRATVRLLNGVSAEPIPAGIIQTVVQIGGSVSVIGNGPSFGRDETNIIYANPDNRGYAELLQAALGGGTVRHDPEAQDSVALTVILGRDVIERASVTTTTADIETDDGPSRSSAGDDPFGTSDSDPGTDPDPEVPE